MLKQIRYFHSVVKLGSFTRAAEEHFISQSAISQQIRALEEELGTPLFERKGRGFELTGAGEFFYKKTLVLMSDYEAVCRELHRRYGGTELTDAAALFSRQYPDVSAEITYANHDALYALLRNGDLDIVLNDQRRAFSDEYINIVLDICEYRAAVSAGSPLASLGDAEIADLKNTPMIILSSPDQQETERRFFRDDLGFKSELIFTEHTEDALMQVIQGKGFMPTEGRSLVSSTAVKEIRLLRSGKPIIRRYCAFMKADRQTEYMDGFIGLLKERF